MSTKHQFRSLRALQDTTPMAISKQLALQKLLEPVVFVSPAENLTYDHWNEARNEFSGLSAELPANVHLMTLEPWKDNTVLLRLEHILQKSDDPAVLSRSAKVNIGWLFSGIQIQSIRETTLAANQFLEDSNRFQWDAKTEETSQGETYEKRMVQALQEEKEKYEQLKMEKNINKEEMKRIAANMQKYSEFNGGYETPEEMREIIHHRRKRYRSADSEKPRFSKKTPFYQSEEADFVKYFPSDSYYDRMDGNRKMATTRTSKMIPRERKQSMEITLEPMQIRTFIVQAKFLD